MPRSQSGLSLVELLVIMAVGVLLLGLLVPVFESARARAHQAKCVANLRALTAPLLLLGTENNNTIETFRGGATADDKIWTLRLAKEFNLEGKPEIWFSPHFVREAKFSAASWRSWGWWTSYSLNLWAPGVVEEYRDEDGQNLARLHLARVEQPANFPLLVTQLNPNAAAYRGRFSFRSPNASTLSGVHLIHNGRANISFVDGHIEAADADRLQQLGFRSAYDRDGQMVNLQ